MAEIVKLYYNPGRIVEIVRELKELGYELGHDFEFAYRPPRDDNFSRHEVAFTEFFFYNDSLSSWFVLKYS